jgi:hypothetical protein
MPPRGLTSQAIRDPSFQLRSRFFASNSSLLIGSDLQETGPGFAATVGLLIRLEDSATYPEAPEDISSLFVGPVQDLGSTVNLDGGGGGTTRVSDLTESWAARRRRPIRSAISRTSDG